MSKKPTLAELRATYKETPREGGNSNSAAFNKYYPFWKMKNGQKAIVRFLPDANEANPRGFLEEKVNHNLTINGQKKSVPCLSMYGEDCPVCKVSQDYYKANDKINGSKYWRKKSYIAQAIVVEDPLPADPETGVTHQGQVRNITVGYQLHEIIKEAFADDEALQGVPYDFHEGHDFIIKKSEQGEYSTYTMGTKFSNKQRALSEDELAVVEEGMIELKSLLPKNPGVEKITAMLNADLNGEEYVESKGGNSSDDEGDEPAPTRRPAAAVKPAAKKAVQEDAPWDEPAKPAAKTAVAAAEGEDGSDVDAMLAQIRARRAAK